MNNAKRLFGDIVGIIGMLSLLQLLRIGIKSVFFIFVERTNYSDRMGSFLAMVILSVIVVLFARIHNIRLFVFPKRFGAFYIILTFVAAILFIVTPFITKESSVANITLLVYSSVVTPVFEELVFRSAVWDKLNKLFRHEWVTYFVNSILFALWHLGYIDALAFRANDNLPIMLFWKAVTGLCFGIVLGAVRLKTKNSYSTMLLHGVINIFGR